MSANGETSLSEPKIALALSGGGARAMAFHLGCLRALHDLGILNRVRVLSTVSGGSVIGALYAASDDPFPAFEARVRAVLARGLVKPAVRTALLTTEGLKAFLCFAVVGTANLVVRDPDVGSMACSTCFAGRMAENSAGRKLAFAFSALRQPNDDPPPNDGR